VFLECPLYQGYYSQVLRDHNVTGLRGKTGKPLGAMETSQGSQICTQTLDFPHASTEHRHLSQ
jgi:hypothetical protein